MSMPMGHLGDLLSALLDGELAYDEAATARLHLQACPFCRAELEATASTRSLVRSLPELEPPAGMIDAILALPPTELVPAVPALVAPSGAPAGGSVIPLDARRPRRARPVAAIAGAAAAVALVAIGLAPHQASKVQPPVSAFVDAHATSTGVDDPISGLAPVAVPVSFSP